MATLNPRTKPPALPTLFAVLILTSFLLLFTLHPSPSPAPHPTPCNYTSGAWIPSLTLPPRYPPTCKEIFKGWNCIASAKPHAADIPRYRWHPHSCPLPALDPLRFLRRHRHTSIGFVGDSLNRNMFASLVCMLKQVGGEVRKWRPAGADRGFTFLEYNVTVAYHRTNLLVRYGRWSASGAGGELESLGYREGYRVDVDLPEHTWAEAPVFHHVLIFNTGHWWYAPSKFDPIQSPMLFFEKGMPVLPPVPPERGMDMALKHMILYVEKSMGVRGIKFFRTQSPRHFEGGDWNDGGSCRRTQPLSSEQDADGRWSPPFEFYKVNHDAGWTDSQASYGIIVRDHGAVISYRYGCLFACSAFEAEGRALLLGLQLAADRGWKNAIFESDCRSLSLLLSHPWKMRSLIEECHLLASQVDQLFSLKNNGTNMEVRLVNQHLYKVLKGSSFQILDTTYMSEFRADAHPSTAGGKKHEDCMHWCLPGLTDSWNDLLAVNLENMQ